MTQLPASFFWPLSYSLSDGIISGYIAYPLIKIAAGKIRGVRPVMMITAVLLLIYGFVFH